MASESLCQSTYNHLVDAVLYTPMTKARYFDVLRAVYARYSVSGWLDAQVKEIASLIGPDARADVLLWNTTRAGFDNSVNRLLTQISVRRSSLAAQLKALNDTTPAEAPAPAPAPRPRVATL